MQAKSPVFSLASGGAERLALPHDFQPDYDSRTVHFRRACFLRMRVSRRRSRATRRRGRRSAGKTVSANTETNLKNIRSYAFHYGQINEKEISALGTYDAAVIDPQAASGNGKKTVSDLIAAGCKPVIGYMSFLEVAEWHGYKDRINDSWTINPDGKPWTPRRTVQNFILRISRGTEGSCSRDGRAAPRIASAAASRRSAL